MTWHDILLWFMMNLIIWSYPFSKATHHSSSVVHFLLASRALSFSSASGEPSACINIENQGKNACIDENMCIWVGGGGMHTRYMCRHAYMYTCRKIYSARNTHLNGCLQAGRKGDLNSPSIASSFRDTLCCLFPVVLSSASSSKQDQCWGDYLLHRHCWKEKMGFKERIYIYRTKNIESNYC